MKNRFHFALLGNNIGYSKSPEIFDVIYQTLKVKGEFEVHSVEPAELGARLRQLALDGVCGFSITIPFKQTVIGCLNDIDPVARALGAVNSVVVDEGQLFGYNTDTYGFKLALESRRPLISGRPAVVLGNGGAARAAAYALWKHYNVSQFYVYGRSPERLQQFREDMASVLPGSQIEVSNSIAQKVPDPKVRLVVNCTPAGGPNQPDALPFSDKFRFENAKVYYDLNYNRPNRAIAHADNAGLVAIDGAAMLVGQALRSFDIWTSVAVEFEPVYGKVFG